MRKKPRLEMPRREAAQLLKTPKAQSMTAISGTHCKLFEESSPITSCPALAPLSLNASIHRRSLYLATNSNQRRSACRGVSGSRPVKINLR
jgi:hypothetical protein